MADVELDLAPFDELAALLKLEGDDISTYPRLELLVGLVTGAVVDHLQRDLGYQDGPERVSIGTAPSRMVPLRRMPIESVASVSVDGVVTSRYAVTDWGVRLTHPVREADVEVVYAGGYTDETLPTAIRRAALFQVTYEFQNADHLGAESVTNEGGTVRRPALQLLPEVLRSLNPYRHPVLTRF